jgi:beta-galactosidase
MSEGIILFDPVMRGDWDSEAKQWKTNAHWWNMLYARPWFTGGSMWCFNDYVSNGIYRVKGVVDYSRLPLDIYYFYKAMWSGKPMVHINGHWNHTGGDVNEIVVFSNANRVELLLNGRSLGSGTRCNEEYPHIPNPPFIWKNIPYEPGMLEAHGFFDTMKLTTKRITSGNASELVLRPEPSEIIADGRDVSFIVVEVQDDHGNRCYTENGTVTLYIDGAGRLAGPVKRDIRAGLARFAVRSSGSEGQINVTASCDCGKSTITLMAKKPG